MLKQTALIVMLLGLLNSPLAWSQDDLDSDDTEMQADEDEASGEDESSGDEGDVQEEEEAVADGSLPEMADSEDAATDQVDDESLADDASEIEDGADLENADPVVTPAPTSPPVVSSPPPAASPTGASCFSCDSARPVGMSNPTGNGLFGMRIPTSKGLFGTAVPTSEGQCSDRQSGIVKWFNHCKGYGFITPAGGQDLFVHFRSIQGNSFKCLKEGQKVTFKVVQGQRGLQADEVIAD